MAGVHCTKANDTNFKIALVTKLELNLEIFMKCILFISGVCIRICVSLSNARFITTHSKTSPGHSCRQALDTTPSHCTSTLTTTSSHSQLPPRVCNGRASSLQRHREDTQELDPRHLRGAPHHHRLGATCRSFQQLDPHFPSFLLSFFPLTTRDRCSFPIFEAASVLCGLPRVPAAVSPAPAVFAVQYPACRSHRTRKIRTPRCAIPFPDL